MRTRITIASILILAFSYSASAQLRFGIRGGINSSNMKVGAITGSDYSLEYAKGDIGYHVGVMAQAKLLGIFIQPELLFTTTKNDIQFSHGTLVYDPGEQVFHKIDIPVMAGVKVGPFKLQAGPVGTMMINSKSDLLDQVSLEPGFNRLSIGYQAGVGLELSSLLVDVKYEGNLSRLGSGVTIAGTDYSFDQRMNQWILSIGFLFGND